MPTGYASACLMFCKRAEAGAPQHKTNSVLAPRNQFSRPCVGLASCRRHGVHASAKVTLQRVAYPFPDGRVAWAVAGARARPVPCQMRIVAQHDDADASERRECREEGADRTEQFRRVDLANPGAIGGPAGRCAEGRLRRIDAEIKAYGAADHHQEQEGLIGECGM